MRKITCTKCGELKPTPSDDAAQGYFERRVHGKSTRHLVCDYCGTALNPGDLVIALSVPRTMGVWEHEYLSKEQE